MKKHFFKLILVCIIGMQSCVKPLPVTIPQMQAKLAINSQIIPNEFIVVSVTRTFTSLYQQSENDTTNTNPQMLDLFVPHALVTILHNNILDTLRPIADGIYASTNIAFINNNSYQLFVYDSTTKQQVSATTTMKELVKIEEVKPFRKIEGKDTSIHIKYVIDDNPAEKNYYYVSVSKTNKTVGSLGLPASIQNIFNKSSYIYLYTDDDVKKSKIIGEFSTTDAIGIKKSDTVLVMVANIEEKYYQYLTAFNKTSSFISQLTGEPINLPTNIKNGYGYFGAHFPYIRYEDLSKY